MTARAALLLMMAATLSACGATVAKLPANLGGLPESVPQRPAETMPFQNVYEVRPTRDAKPLNDEEQKKLEAELTALRDAQNQRINAPYPPPPPAPPPPAAKAAAKKPKVVAAKKPDKPAPPLPLGKTDAAAPANQKN